MAEARIAGQAPCCDIHTTAKRLLIPRGDAATFVFGS